MKKINVLVMLLAMLTVFNGCLKEELNEIIKPGKQTPNLLLGEGQMVLGQTLENPYSVENMQKANENLTSANQLKSAIKIEATHYYVRFRPKNEQELEILKRDATLDIFDYPLDVEIKKGGTHYHDPQIPANQITWQYTVVPVNYVFPNMQYQVLANLFLMENNGEFQKLKSASADYFDWLKLETEALRITGNLDSEMTTGETLKSVNWTPSGTIRVWDNLLTQSSSGVTEVFDHWEYYNCNDDGMGNNNGDPLIDPMDPTILIPLEECQRAVYRYESNSAPSNFIPVEGIEVRATRWFTTHKGYTDANGNFTCDGTFTRDANYSIKWERWDFDIRDGVYGQAYFNGPKQTGSWHLQIEQNNTPKSFLFAHIFRAAHTYYYKHGTWA